MHAKTQVNGVNTVALDTLYLLLTIKYSDTDVDDSTVIKCTLLA